MDDIVYKKGVRNILIFFFVIFILLAIRGKYLDREIKQNESYAVGEVLKIYYGKGRSVDFKYSIGNEEFVNSSCVFTKNITQVGKKYFVIVNINDYSHAYILGDCPYDENKHGTLKYGFDKIPDEALQKKADEAFEEIFNSPLGRILPPY